ncbi:polysialyltransferase family glycosyltransferase [Methylococcus sp. EFPC2]|uniref:polysialyltransferase family glycosyltransferase n=1 Tax=Methylococcus sp. EFPC2 TaxID=2812648 RepID=UPI001967E9D3|nr:polysialyltransferase family glycosyltransferase [Methylococcus sp. EFPC2]QSA96241.1 hypothetical protein JWZ97_13525 [Methylococcus sp. EFPC2]
MPPSGEFHAQVNVYCVASPLHYLAVKRIAKDFEREGRQVLLYYQRGVEAIVRKEDWDAVYFLPWPRKRPLPGLFGQHRRLLENLRNVAALVGPCDVIHLHAPVFDAEGTNYFLRGLPRLTGATKLSARILPDGLISIRRYPLSLWKHFTHFVRKARRLVSPELDYWCFSGDRIGSDAPFVDRIYTLPGLPHEYPADKVVVLPPLVEPSGDATRSSGPRALVIGQPLTGNSLLAEADLPRLTERIHRWLADRGVEMVDYKGHPRDPRLELKQSGDTLLTLDEPIESYMSHTHYDFVVGVRSSALLFARQIYGPDTRVAAFGWDLVQFKSDREREDMAQVFSQVGVEMLPSVD